MFSKKKSNKITGKDFFVCFTFFKNLSSKFFFLNAVIVFDQKKLLIIVTNFINRITG